MKRKVKRFIEVLIFLMIVAFAFEKVSLICKVYGKGYDDTRSSALFYYLPKNSVDVIFLGDSKSFTTYINKQIYDESGIASATLAGSSSSIINCYYELKEAFVKQKNCKVVVMDVQTFRNSLCSETFSTKPLSVLSSLPSMPELSINKWRCYFDMKQLNYGAISQVDITDIIGITQYRQDFDRKNDIKKLTNLIVNPSAEFKMLGYFPLNSGMIMQIDEIKILNESDDVIDLANTMEYKYFLDIYSLCKSNNCELIFTNLPYCGKRNDKYITKQVEEIANNLNIKYIDFFNLVDEIGIEKEIDYMDEIHFNFWGAKKITSYMAKYLLNNFKFEDHSKSDIHSLWNEDFDYSKYDEELKKNLVNIK